jgi:ionotropic glutamate receptor
MFLLQDSTNIRCNCGNATVFFVRPKPDEKFTEQYRLLKEEYNLKGRPEITAAFYFDVALRTMLATK